MDNGIPLPLWCFMAHDHSHTNNSYQNPACCSCGSCVMGKPNITPSNANINPSRRSSIHTAMDARMAAKHLRCHPVPPKKRCYTGCDVQRCELITWYLRFFLLFFCCCCCRLINHLQKLLEAATKKRIDQLFWFLLGTVFARKMFSSQKFRRLEASRSHWSQLEVEV